MKESKVSKDHIRYGLTPAAFLELGWVIILAMIIAMAGLFRLISWGSSILSGS